MLCFAVLMSTTFLLLGIQILLCEWHRQQAVSKWLRGSPVHSGLYDDVSRMLINIARATDVMLYLNAVWVFTHSEVFLDPMNVRLRAYWENWEKDKEVSSILHS